jgi:ribosomal protein S18 acetylase RimI-like enzyme
MIEELPPERVDELEPLWSALREHHGRVKTIDQPIRAREESWALRRETYLGWLEGDSFVLVARRDGRAIGYAMVHITGPGATLETGERTGEVETLSVAPEARGDGVGTALLDAVDQKLLELGIRDVSIGIMVGNDRAQQLYESLGFEHLFTVLSKRL